MDNPEKQSLLAEIEKYSPRLETYQPSDLTVDDIAAHYGCGIEAARRKIYAISKDTPGFCAIIVKRNRRYILVLRKKGE